MIDRTAIRAVMAVFAGANTTLDAQLKPAGKVTGQVHDADWYPGPVSVIAGQTRSGVDLHATRK